MQNLLVLSKNWLSYSPETIKKLCDEDGQNLEPKAYLKKQINETSSKNIGLGIRIENYSHLKLEIDNGNGNNEFTDIDPFKEHLFVILDSSQSIQDSVSWKVKLDPKKSHNFFLTYDEPNK